MKFDPLLNKAARLARKRDFEGALKILKEGEDSYNRSFKYYNLCGIICLYSGSHVEALSNFKLARQIKMNDPSTMLGLAVLYLKRMNTVQAVDYYLDVKEIDPKNKIAKKALALIRKHSSSEDFSDWLTAQRLEKLFPRIPAPSISFRSVLISAGIVLAALIVTYGVLISVNILPNPFPSRNIRNSESFVLSGDDRAEPVETGGSYMYILTRDEATALYDRSLSLFTEYRDEAAKINLNRILASNASEGLKNRARLLMDNMETPGFDNFRRSDNPSYGEVKNEPVIYRDVHVIWRGMATNVEITDEFTRFDLLVGYDTRRTLEGIVPVIFYNPVAINTERALEVLGKITLSGSSFDIKLEGVAIHQSGRLEE